MTRRLILSYLSITVFALAVLVYPLGVTFADRERERLDIAIERDAGVLASLAEDRLEGGATDLPEIHPVVGAYTDDGGGRVVIVDARGISVLDSDDLDGPRRDFSTRPEFMRALAGQSDVGTRASDDLGDEFRYVAVPVASGGEIHGAVRIWYATSNVESRIRGVWLRLALLSAVVVAAVALVGFVLARSVTRPVRTLRTGAEGLARGELDRRVVIGSGAPPELRALADTFNRSAGQLQQMVERQRAFVADASHQLRSPLTAMRLRLETMDVDPESPDAVKLDAAIAEVDRLNRLVDGLLVLARVDGARPAPVTVDVGPMITDRVAHWDQTARARDVSLVVDPPIGPDPVLAEVVAGTLETALDNLIDNAISASPAGGTVRVSARGCAAPGTDAGSAGEIAIHVVDSGPGLTAEQRARAFDRFWRAPGSGRSGSGLGLAIVADLMVINGGRAEIAPGPDGGLDAQLVAPGPRTFPRP